MKLEQDNELIFKDDYPSRVGGVPQIIDRQDPVVYSVESSTPPISVDMINQYKLNGFLILNEVFTQDEVAAMQAELIQLRMMHANSEKAEVISELESGSVRSIFNIHQSDSLFRQLGSDERLAGLAQYILNDDVYIHQSRLNIKPGFRGKEFYWHSDFETWHVEDGMPRMRALSISVMLTENYEHNGPLMLVPGSHQHFVTCEGVTPENHHLNSLKKQIYGTPEDGLLNQLIKAGGIQTAVCKPGSVVIFDCNTMHGSNGNMTPYPRSNVFFVYNSISNRVVKPYCGNPPRPEYICSRKHIEKIKITKGIG